MNSFVRFLAGFVGMGIACTGLAQSVNLDSLPVWPFEKFTEVAQANLERANKRPLIFHFKHKNGGELYYFGSSHFYDPQNPLAKMIDSIWKAYKPDIVFWEGGIPGRPGVLPESKEACIEQKGEPGLVRYLARENNIPDNTLEPPPFFDRNQYTDEQIVVSIVLSQAEQFNRKNLVLPDSLVAKLLDQINSRGLTNGPRTIADLTKAIRKHFPRLTNWKNVTGDFVGPKCKGSPNSHFINHMGCEGNTRRDRHMVKVLLEEVVKGKKVFAVVGASHLLSQEPAFIAFFGTTGELE